VDCTICLSPFVQGTPTVDPVDHPAQLRPNQLSGASIWALTVWSAPSLTVQCRAGESYLHLPYGVLFLPYGVLLRYTLTEHHERNVPLPFYALSDTPECILKCFSSVRKSTRYISCEPLETKLRANARRLTFLPGLAQVGSFSITWIPGARSERKTLILSSNW
jgi:hypothetical protein